MRRGWVGVRTSGLAGNPGSHSVGEGTGEAPWGGNRASSKLTGEGEQRENFHILKSEKQTRILTKRCLLTYELII